ncbi:hypothetical protein ACHQM5_003715 [Ranunculus cassubicifolius]
MPRSSSNKEKKGSCCCSTLISLGLSGFTLWLVFSFYNPILSIEEFHVPALNKAFLNTTTTTQNTTIIFDLKLWNKNLDKGIRYNDLNLTLYYGEGLSVPVATFIIPTFYQGHRKTAHRIGSVEAAGVPWEEARKGVLNGSKVVFRVDLKTRVRYTTTLWIKKRKTIMVGKTLEVNDAGEMVKKGDKGVKLSGAPGKVSYGVWLSFFCFSLLL